MGFLIPLAMAGIGAVGSAVAGIGAAAGSFATAAGAATASMGASAISTGLGIAGDVVSGIGSLQQGLYASKVAKNNAQIAAGNAEAAGIAGNQAESLSRLRSGAVTAAGVTATAANNIDVASPTAKNTRSANELAGEMDALTIRYNAARQVYGYNLDKSSYLAQSANAKQAGYNALAGSFLKAGNTFLSGASSLGDKWMGFQQSGALSSSEVPY